MTPHRLTRIAQYLAPLLLSAVFLTAHPAAAQPRYTVIDLDQVQGTSPDDALSQARAIGAGGSIVGYTLIHRAGEGDQPGNYDETPVLWSRTHGPASPYVRTALPAPRPALWEASAGAIYAGAIAGSGAPRFQNGPIHAFLWAGGIFTDLERGTPTAQSWAHGLNATLVVGSREADRRTILPVTWQRRTGALHVLPTLGTGGGEALAINSGGVIVGESSTGADLPGTGTGIGTQHATMWLGDFIYDLDRSPTSSSTALALNDYWQVVGHQNGHAFLWTLHGGMQTLPDLPGNTDSYASAMNNQGLIIGESRSATSAHPVLWVGGQPFDLQGLLDTPGWTVESVWGINDSGVMVGRGVRSGETKAHSLVLMPQLNVASRH